MYVTKIDLATLAEKCAIELLRESNLDPTFVHQAVLLGSTLFEYHAVDLLDLENISKQCQIFISLNSNQTNTPQLATDVCDWLLYLLTSYHKILHIYQEARNRYPKARELYSKCRSKKLGVELIKCHLHK